jgi:predicted NBD/HSP70 family sugar kinase
MRLPHEHLITQRMQAPVMRSLNGIELLNLIGEHGPVSRANLAKLSRLSKPTVSSQVEALIRQGWVVEVGPGKSGVRGGKKPLLVKFNADAGRLYAADIDPARIRIAAADLQGNIQRQVVKPLDSDRRADTVLAILISALRDLIRDDRAAGDQRVVSIAAPGRVDVRRGVVLDAGNVFNWTGVPIRSRVEKAIGFPVFVDNNVKMATLGESHFGAAKGAKDVVLIRLDTGIGSGVMIRGKMLHGSNWAAGEIAHMILDLSQATEDWHVRGYLESMVGADRILERGRSAGVQTVTSHSALDFLNHARDSSGPAKQLFQDVILHIGVAIANMICAYDPSLVVLQGELLASILGEVEAVVTKAVPWETRIALSEIGDEAVLLGAMVAARAHAYERIVRMFNEPAENGVEGRGGLHVNA